MDLTKGLYLEAYGDDDLNEEYKLMFMEVKVTKNWKKYLATVSHAIICPSRICISPLETSLQAH